MKDLDLSSNKLNNITLTFFENMPNLINLDLANNNISKVYSGYFRKLNSLRYLNVSHNNIMFLEISSFSGLSHLETLDMSSNKLISLPDNIFHNTGSLVNLYIRNNSLTMLEPEDLFHSTHLKKIDIDQNVMTCNMIAHILKSFNKLKVTVIHGSSFGNISLNGINCMYDQEVIISNSDNENEIVKKVYADFKKSDLFNFFKNLDSSAIKDIPVALRDIARSKKQENNNLFAVSNLYNPIQNLQVKEEKLNNKIMFTNVLLGCFLICFVMQLIFKCYIYWKPNQQQHQEHNELYDLN
ncbi:PREDICTED: leucine-rich repeat-containing protein 70-like [Nicrophorus vespilloides]|uniref:Leucine-rich repeat-containing protein 70-like n=1 Tax=Nicrophorus vespilloides TaxID=110193 RepID=A0ABM1MUA1_NICVS|nr:PREDICTED: leucine-rich repeat-containing protein 70-like [Nicrophorus vespilloides]